MASESSPSSERPGPIVGEANAQNASSVFPGLDASTYPSPPPPVEVHQAEKRLGELLGTPPLFPGEYQHQNPASAAAHGLSSAELPAVGGYQIEQELGRGGMGVVYLARQANPKRLVALKVISAAPLANEQAAARFRREAEVIGQLQHTNIVPIHEVGDHSGRPYFTMEFLSGGNLTQKLSKTPMPARAAAQLVETLARAIQAAHEGGFVHRDLKPSNILLAADGTPKISDFGLAKELANEAASTAHDLTETGALLGTPNYMAPEQACGRPVASQGRETSARFGAAVDVYGLGAILYECLTGLPPFRAASVLETLDLVRSQEPIPPSHFQQGLPRDLQTICLKCLEKNPLRRYASAQELAEDLRRFRAGEPIHALPVSAFGRLVKWGRRRPAWAALWTLAFVAAVGGAGGIAYHTSQLHDSLLALSAKETQIRQAKEEADANYREARATINQMLRHSEERVRTSAIPQVRELVAQQAVDALQFFRAVAAKNPEPDPEMQFELARALADVGRHRGLLGDRAQAVASLREALQILQDLPASDSPPIGLQLGQVHLYLAENLVGQTNAEAEQHYLQARTILEDVKERAPSLSDVDLQRASSRHQLAILYRQTKRYALAEEQLREALPIWDSAFVDPNVQPIWLNRKADSYVMLGLVLYFKKEYAAARLAYIEAEKWCRKVRERLPEDLDVVATLATLYLDWGLLDEAEEHNEEALRRYTAALDLLEPALLREPNMTRLRIPARNAHGAHGSLSNQLGRFAEQAEDVRRYGELGPSPVPASLKLSEAGAWARSGDYLRAMSEVDQLLAKPPAKLEWSDYRELAATAALAMTAVRMDSKLSPAEQSALADRYGGRAVQFLVEAAASVDAKNAETLHNEMKTDDRFAPLRSRPDFPGP